MDTADSQSNWILEKIGNLEETYRLRLGSNIIGRHSSADFQIDSFWVSRKHAEITVTETNKLIIQIKDLQTLNGTYVNDTLHRNETVTLKRGDLLGFGVNSDNSDVVGLPLYCLRYRPIVYNEPKIISYHEISDIEEVAPSMPINIKTEDRIDVKPNIMHSNTSFSNMNLANASEIKNINENLTQLDVKPTICELTKKVITIIDLSSDDEAELQQLNVPKFLVPAKTEILEDELKNIHPNVQLPSSSPNCFDVSNESNEENAIVTDVDNKAAEIDRESSVEDADIYSQVVLDEMKSDMVDEDKRFYLDDFYKIDLLAEEEDSASPIISLDDDDDGNQHNNNNNNDDDNNVGEAEEYDEDDDKLLEIWSQKLFSSQIYPKMNLSQEFSPTRSDVSHLSASDETNNEWLSVPLEEENNLLQSIFKPIQNSSEDTTPLLLSPQDSDTETKIDAVSENTENKKISLPTQLKVDQAKSHNEIELMQSPIICPRKRRLDDSKDKPKMDLSVEEAPPKITVDKFSKESSLAVSITKSRDKPKRTGPQIINPLPLKKRRSSKSQTTKPNTTPSVKSKTKKPSKCAERKDERKERLKNLSTKNSNSNTSSTKSVEEIKVPPSTISVKNTKSNRGAFLLQIDDAVKPATAVLHRQKSETKLKQLHQSEIPLLKEVKEEWLERLDGPTATTTNKKGINQNQLPETLPLDQAMAECYRLTNQVIRKNAEMARARDAPRKLRFADFEKSFEEKERLDQKLEQKLNSCVNRDSAKSISGNLSKIPKLRKQENVAAVATAAITTETIPTSVVSAIPKKSKKPKKTVRFAPKPIIYYFESESLGHLRKVDSKDLLPRLPLKTRRELILQNYVFLNRSKDLLRQILKEGNEFLFNKHDHKKNQSQLDEALLSVPTKFESFEHYLRVFMRLMKFEFWAMLERDMSFHSKKKPQHLHLINVFITEDYFRLETYSQLAYPKKCDLVLLRIGEAKIRTFGYMVNCTRAMLPSGLKGSKILIDILLNSVEINYLQKSELILMEMAMDNLQVIIGAYNGIYQLECSPLTQMILNPAKLLESDCKTPDRVVTLEIPKDTVTKNNELNEMQSHAVQQIFKRACLNKTDTTPNITLVQGPPGTGKSIVIFKTVLQILYGMQDKFRDKKILICSQSNAAVDVVAAKLLDARRLIKNKHQRFQLVRFGFVDKMMKQVQPLALKFHVDFERVMKVNATLKTNFQNIQHFQHYLKAIEQDSSKANELKKLLESFNSALSPIEEEAVYKKYLDGANVVLTTLSSCVKLAKFVKYFDICIIYAATHCTEPWTMLPLQFGISSLILVGDSQQLPATVLSAQAGKNGLSQSLFTRIQRCIDDELKKATSTDTNNSTMANNNENDIIYHLRTQYRMHPEICKFPNAFFYQNNVLNAPITQQHTTPLVSYAVLNLQCMQNLDLSQGKIVNQSEADFVMELLIELNKFIPTSTNSYGIVTPYAQHRNILDRAVSNSGLPHITVQTIDAYQGVEKDVVIISNARTNGIGFLSNPQRLNVALTRPKKCLILCGNFKKLQSVPAWRSLLEDAKKRSVYHYITQHDISDVKNRVISRLLLRK